MNFDWADLAFGSKKPLKELKATFIVAPRDISTNRLKQLLKEYLPKGNIVLGISKEKYVVGFEDQPQFKTLQQEDVQKLVDQVALSKSPNKLYLLSYSQRELAYIFEKVPFREVLLVNGSWHNSFHTTAPYYALVKTGTPFTYVSAFCDEVEAKTYEQTADKLIPKISVSKSNKYTEEELLATAQQVAKASYDFTYQIGVVLAKRSGNTYQLLDWSFNKVVPYQTYAMLNGASREQNLSPVNDQNHYDTVHAETMLVIKAAEQGTDLNGTSLFINVLPCPTCARMLSQTTISEVVYTQDHSDGYAVKMLEQSGKKVRRIVL